MTKPAEQDPASKADKAQTPPWGDAENFDPERAWRLIENLREEVASIKAERDALKADADKRADAEKTDLQRAVERAEAAEQRAKEAERSLWTERALRKHPLPEGLDEETEAEFLAFLSGDSEEEIVRKAARLEALRGGAKSADEKPDGEQGAGAEQSAQVPGKPAPALVPGHGGDAAEPFDPDAVAQAARASYY